MALTSKTSFIIAKETTFNVAATSGGQVILRTGSQIGHTRDYFSSQNIRSEKQTLQGDFGVEKISGSVSGELGGKRHCILMEGLFSNSFAPTKTSVASGSITVGAPANGVSQLTGAGVGITGVAVGDIVKFAVSDATFDQLNLLVVFVTSNSDFKVISLHQSTALVATTLTGQVLYRGKEVTINPDGSNSYTIQDGYADIGKYAVYSGCKIQSMDISASPNSIVTNSFNITGSHLASISATSTMTTPADYGFETKSFATTYGVLRLAGTTLGGVTSVSLNVSRQLSPSEYMLDSSRASVDIAEGQYTITGKFTVALKDKSLQDLYAAEALLEVILVFQGGSAKNSPIVRVLMPAVMLKAPVISVNSDFVMLDCEFEAHMTASKKVIYIQDTSM